jgi:hypothetical protein
MNFNHNQLGPQFIQAAAMGQLELVEALIYQGADIDFQDPSTEVSYFLTGTQNEIIN